MNNVTMPAKGAQIHATRIGYFVAFFAILCGCLCLAALWVGFVGDSLAILKTSWYLESNGEKISGIITDFEEFSGVNPTSGSTQMLIVDFIVNGEKYTVKSYSTYPVGRYALGDSVEVIYDPLDPATAQIDLFMERWFTPVLSTLPF